jgi:hypothetical protein
MQELAGTGQAPEQERTMIDSFVLLAPILMLGVIALLGFVGCSFPGHLSAPTNVQATPGNEKVTVSWDDIGYVYDVKRGETSGNYPDSRTVMGSETIFTNLTNGTTYFFVVKARPPQDYESDTSEEVSAIPVRTTVDIVATVPTGSPTIDSRSAAYSSARAGSNPSFVSIDEHDRLNIVNALYNLDFVVREGFVEFDTSAIPTSAVIDSAVLTLTSYRDEGAAALDQIVEVRISDFGATFDTTDFVPGANLSALTLIASRAVEPSTRPLGTAEPFDDVALAANIVKGGITRIIVHDQKTRIGTEPSPGTAQSDCAFCSPAHGTAAFRPKLTITY